MPTLEELESRVKELEAENARLRNAAVAITGTMMAGSRSCWTCGVRIRKSSLKTLKMLLAHASTASP
jgi:hypothetical protein